MSGTNGNFPLYRKERIKLLPGQVKKWEYLSKELTAEPDGDLKILGYTLEGL